jgi:hypothetical protein
MTTKIFEKLNATAPSHGVSLAAVTYRDGKAVDIAPFFNERVKIDAPVNAAAHLPLSIQRILAGANIKVPASGKLRVSDVDSAFKRANLSTQERMRQKSALYRAGLLD